MDVSSVLRGLQISATLRGPDFLSIQEELNDPEHFVSNVSVRFLNIVALLSVESAHLQNVFLREYPGSFFFALCC